MDGEERRVTHFWYIGWSDHSSPEATLESARNLLELVHESEACRHRTNCSSLLSTSTSTLVPSLSLISTTSISANSQSTSSRSLLRQAAQDWSDFDLELRHLCTMNSSATALSHISFRESEYSTPNLPSASLNSYRASNLAPSTDSSIGPIVVHCSAGVGRTGCFIALSIGCEQLRNEDKVDVLGIVSRLRLDRGGMVENSEQYAFLHAALCMYNAIRNGRELPVLPVISNLHNQFTGLLR